MSDLTNEISQLRQNVQEMFERELEVKIVPGKLEGPNQWGDWLGSVCLTRIQEVPARVNEQQTFLLLRVFAPFTGDAVLSPHQPYDPAPLEQMADKILWAIARNQTGLGAWFQRVTAIEIDPDTQGVQASILAYSGNAGTLSA